MKNTILKQIIKNYNLTLSNIGEVELDRKISHAAIHRLGLELAGKKAFGQHNNIIGWGTKEQNYFNSIGLVEAKKLINKSILPNVPFVLLSVGIKGKVLEAIIEAGDKTKTPILTTDMHLSLITSTVGFDIAIYLAQEKEMHSSLVIVNGVGVMLKGKSGVGKSEAVLELIQKGHIFVSDDTVVIKRIGDKFFGYPTEITKDILEVRGVGLIDIRAIYGIKTVRNDSKIDLIVELKEYKGNEGKFERLGKKIKKEKILGGFIPKITIPVMQGRSISSLIMVAVNAYLAKEHGDDPIQKMRNRREE